MKDGHGDGRRAITFLLVGYLASYACLIALGYGYFVAKTILVPGFIFYALASRQTRSMAVDWLPFGASLMLFDALRGAIYVAVREGVRPELVGYVIDWEQWILGTPAAPIVLQSVLRHSWVDRVAILFHGAHFLVFLIAGLALWHHNRDAARRYQRAILYICGIGLASYFAVPTVPPWLAYQRGALTEPVVHVTQAAYVLYFPTLYYLLNVNPVAAMPSLHAAFPVVVALAVGRAWGWPARTAAWANALGVWFAIMYLGEHYLVDVIAGAALAVAADRVSGRMRVRAPRSVGASIVISSALTLAAGLVAYSTLSHYAS
jgi:hypothetical protein